MLKKIYCWNNHSPGSQQPPLSALHAEMSCVQKMNKHLRVSSQPQQVANFDIMLLGHLVNLKQWDAKEKSANSNFLICDDDLWINLLKHRILGVNGRVHHVDALILDLLQLLPEHWQVACNVRHYDIKKCPINQDYKNLHNKMRHNRSVLITFTRTTLDGSGKSKSKQGCYMPKSLIHNRLLAFLVKSTE